jgi:fatty-acyl-CoA synthase
MFEIPVNLTTKETAGYTIGELLDRRVELFPEHPVQVYRDPAANQTYSMLKADADLIAKALIALMGDCPSHAAIWAPNGPEWLSILFGSARAGIPLVTVNTSVKALELEYILKQSDTRLLFIAGTEDEPFGPISIFREVCPLPGSMLSPLPELEYVVFLGSEPGPGIMTFDQFLESGKAVDDDMLCMRAEQVSPQDTFLIQYTSGTTGKPKGAMLSHAAYCINIFAMAHRLRLNPEDICCIPAPLFHAYGCLHMLASVAAGCSVTLLEKFNPVIMLRTIEDCKATMIYGTPSMFIAAFHEMGRSRYNLSSLKGGNMSGAPCPPELVRRVCTEMGADEFGVLFGSTETVTSIMTDAADSLEHRTGSLGKAMPDVEIRIVDHVSGVDVPMGKPGELWVKTLSLMTGYYKNPDATAAAIDHEGWFHSGDMVSRDADGYIHVTGRIKDVIIRGGENLFPAEIEEFLLTHEKIMDAQVVSIPSSYYGEEAVAYVRLKPGMAASPLELKQYCRRLIAIEKVPSTFIIVDAYPLTASGKVQKFRLREMAQEALQNWLIE